MSYSSEVLADSPLAYLRLGDSLAPSITATTASSAYSGQAASNAFDGSYSTCWNTASGATGWLRAQYASAFVATSYAVAGGLVSLARAPKDWTFEGSNNGTSWTVLDTRSGVTGWASPSDLRTYTFTNATAYSYYRLNVTANNGDAYLNVTELAVGLAADASGNGRHGAYLGGPISRPGLLVSDTDAAVEFNGTTQSVSISDAAWMDVSSVTLEAWIKPDVVTSYRSILNRDAGSGTPTQRSFDFRVSNTGKVELIFWTTSTGPHVVSGATTLVAGSTYHVAATFDASTVTLYVNGASDGSGSFSGNLRVSNTPLSVGVQYQGGTPIQFFDGVIDEAAFYGTALSAARILAHYNAGVTAAQTVQLAGTVPAVTGAFSATVLERMDLAGSVPAVTGAFTVDVLARIDLSGTVPPVTGAFTLAFEDQILSLNGQVPPVTGSFSVDVIENISLDGQVPAVTGSFTLLPEGETVALAGTVPAVTGTFTLGGPPRTLTGNIANGISVSVSMPLAFTPDVIPPPASHNARRVIAATAFGTVDLDATTATYTTVTEKASRDRLRLIIGGKDVSYINGAETGFTYQLVSPLLWGPATATFPGIKTPFRRIGTGTLKWLRPFSTVKAQLIDSDGNVTATVYKGLVQAWNIDGTDLTVQIGGEAAGRAAMQWRPLPVFSNRRKVGRIAHGLIRREMGLPFKPFLGPNNPDTTLDKIGGMWLLDAIEYLCRMSQQRDGTTYSIMPGNDGAYRFQAKDTSTIDATVYVDGTRVRANVRRDMAEEPNRVFATAVTPNGERLSGIVAAGIIQGPVPAWAGSPLSEGDTGEQVELLVNRLATFGYLTRRDTPGGYDADVTEAVKDMQEDAGLPETGIVNEATWDALWSLNVTGNSLRFAHREPASQQPRTRRWNRTPDGAIIGKNPNYDPRYPRVDVDLDMGANVTARQRRRWARAERMAANEEAWVGTIEVTTGAVIAGEHNPGDPLTEGDLLDFRRLRPGMNLWCPGFQSDTGTLFHISGVDADGKTLLVDTKARDTLNTWDVVQRQREERRWRNGRRASGELKDTVGEWDGAAGGVLYQDVPLTGGKWTVFTVAAGQEGTVSRLRLRTTPNAEYAVEVFGKQVTADILNRKFDAPLTQAGYDKFSDHDKKAWLKSREWLYGAGEPDDPCGYNDKPKSRGGTLDGAWDDDAGFSYRTERYPVLYVAVWSDRDSEIPAGRIMWNQLEPGA